MAKLKKRNVSKSTFGRHPLLARQGKTKTPSFEGLAKVEGDSLTKIFALLRNQSHVDFTHYKHTTVKRRIARRMVLQKKKKLEDYVSYLQSNPQEVRDLFADILINVTEFFRDPDIFVALKKRVLPEIIKNRAAGSPIRIWVIGCATGEEAYSVAIALLELLGDTAQKRAIQIFATDISEKAIQKARAGVYSESIRKNVSEERLKRFFVKTETGYKINKFIREMCLFSRHDVTSDPPFAKLDLICCRNLFIYFDSALQKRVLPILNYALNPGGFLWLGTSESVGDLSVLFQVIDKAKKFYLRGTAPVLPRVQFGASSYLLENLESTASKSSRKTLGLPDFQSKTEQVLISEYAPPGVVVNSNMEIILARGDTSPYFKLPMGQVSLNLFKMARSELVPDLRMAIQAAKKKNIRVKKEGLSILDGDQQRFLNISVIPIRIEPGDRERHFWILFEQASELLSLESLESPESKATYGRGKRSVRKISDVKDRRIKELERELAETRAYQQALAEDHEATQDEITSANEELQSTNEELQSTNEELETAKEELQSMNEELTTVNDELQNRNIDLMQVNNDLINLLGAVDFPIIMVGADGRIRRFTPTAGKLLNLRPSDVGRPIGDIRPDFEGPDLQTLVSDVMETITVKEQEVCSREVQWYRLQARPYKTIDNRIDGAVISLIDITLLKEHLTESQTALKYATAVADTLPLPLVVLDRQLHLLSANQGSIRMFGIEPDKDIGSDLMSVLGGKGWEISHLRQLLVEVITEDRELKNFEIEYDFPEMGNRIMLMNAQQIRWQDTMPKAMLLSIEDVTESKRLLKQEKEARAEAEHAKAEAENSKAEAECANQAKDLFLATLSHELRTPLTSILSWSQLLQRRQVSPEKAGHGLEIIEQNALAQEQLINDLLDISRIQSGKLSLTLVEVSPDDIVRAAIESLRPRSESKKIVIQMFDGANGKVQGDPARLQQIIWNLLTNALKFSPEGSKVEVHIAKVQEYGHMYVSIRVVDHGKGIDLAFLPDIFTRFSQQDSTSTRIHGGLGIGLALVRDLVRSHSGSVKAESQGPGQGATFTVLLPMVREGELRAALPLEGSKQTAKPAPPDLSGLRILIVDDEPGSLEAFAAIIKSFGGKPIQCSSVHDAMTAFGRFRPDVVVSDIAMPFEDGYGLIRQIRALPIEKGGLVPAIALTAYAAHHDIELAVAAGFQEHMAKPVDSEKFARVIARLAKNGSIRQ